MSHHHQKAFTLIEVMVASVILFTSIAVVSVIYRGAFISSQKAEQHVEIVGVLPAVLAEIRNDIRLQGNTELTELTNNASQWDINYQWRAVLTSLQSAAPTFSPEEGAMVSTLPRYKLWQVHLTLSKNNTTKEYTFKEVSWLDN